MECLQGHACILETNVKYHFSDDLGKLQRCSVEIKCYITGEVKDRFLRVQGAGISGHNDWTEASPTGDEQGCLEACEAKLGCRLDGLF